MIRPSCGLFCIRPPCGLHVITLYSDPSILRRLYRPIYGHKIIHRLCDPSTLWRLYRPLYGLVTLFTVLVIRPLCGVYTVHFMDS